MLFPTMTFGLFFVVVLAVAWRLSGGPVASPGWKLWVLAASYVFYAWADPRFCLLLGGSTLVNWWVGNRVRAARGDAVRKGWLTLGVGANLVVLGFFKYYGFFVDSVLGLLQPLGLAPTSLLITVALPVGISFYTFCAISYLIDVFREDLEPVGLMDFAVYLAFFPHLVAGPIVRVSEFVPQLYRRPSSRSVDASRAVRLICRGLFKKVVIANFLATAIVDPVFVAPAQHTNLELLVGAWAYAVQIYADFSGYTDIAIGVALLLGIRFPDNFDRPYSATSIQEFWRRWHMTLSRWLRDYLYVPLGGNRGGAVMEYRNLFLTMLLGGLWHGASWTFVFWGAFHGTGLAVERWVTARRAERRVGIPPSSGAAVGRPVSGPDPDATLIMDQPVPSATRARAVDPVHQPHPHPWRSRLWVFHFVVVGWIFFRADSFADALAYLAGLVTNWGVGELVTPAVLLAIVVGMVGQFLPARFGAVWEYRISRLDPMLLAVGVGVVLVVINLLGPQGVAPFIYFQF